MHPSVNIQHNRRKFLKKQEVINRTLSAAKNFLVSPEEAIQLKPEEEKKIQNKDDNTVVS